MFPARMRVRACAQGGGRIRVRQRTPHDSQARNTKENSLRVKFWRERERERTERPTDRLAQTARHAPPKYSVQSDIQTQKKLFSLALPLSLLIPH